LKYVRDGLEASFDTDRIRKFLPIVYDPKGYASRPKPEGLYYRILKKKDEEAIQFFIHWDEQDCRKEYFGFGHLFTHRFDYEPIIAFARDDKVTALVVAGGGNLLQGGHQTEIYGERQSLAVRQVAYRTSKTPEYPFGEHGYIASVKEAPIASVTFEDKRPALAVATCYHVYTAVRSHLYGSQLAMRLSELSNNVLDSWYEDEYFGHDVSDPWEYPHIRYYPSPKMKALIEQRADIAPKNHI